MFDVYNTELYILGWERVGYYAGNCTSRFFTASSHALYFVHLRETCKYNLVYGLFYLGCLLPLRLHGIRWS